jgi:hypothetical protein
VAKNGRKRRCFSKANWLWLDMRAPWMRRRLADSLSFSLLEKLPEGRMREGAASGT